jgi:gas vesicle protein
VGQTRRTLNSVGLALVAGAVGAAAGVLFAPASGRETRRRASRRLTEEGNALLKKGHRIVGDATEFIQDQWEEGSKKVRKAMTA